jgi:hypothetical protein
MKNIRTTIVIISTIIYGFSGNFNRAFSQENELLLNTYHQISSNDIQTWVKEMVHPKYKGRLAGSPEYMDIAQWAAEMFQQWGIAPYGDNNTFFQYFDRPWTEVKSSGSVILRTGKTKKNLIPGKDFYPGANPDNGKINAPLVFAGHGITYPEMNYDDYAGIDVKEKIVLITGDVPYKGKDSDTSAMWTFYNSHRYKYANAYEHGASGVLIVDMMASPGTPFYKNFLYAAVNDDIARYIFEAEQLSYDSVIKDISLRMKPHSFVSNTSVEITTDVVRHESGSTANVIGFIEGTDPELKKEVILIGAHLDGQGSLGFVLPGALDNASGVAVVLAAAKALAQMKGTMKRSILFILFGGEECGLLGSLHYADNPKIPLENIILMINLDMVGNGTGLAVWGGKSYPELLSHFETMNSAYIHRSFSASENRPVKGRPRTDGLVFLMRGVPTVHFGISGRVNPIYYHKHQDTEDLLTYESMEDAARLLFLGVWAMASQ